MERVIIIGGSAGSIDAVMTILTALPVDFQDPIIIVLHRMKNVESNFVELLKARTGKKQINEIEDKEEIKKGTIYIAPANYHVLAEEDGTFSLDYSEAVNFSRPSIDVAFDSFARVYRSRLTGILLSGSNADGAQSLYRVYRLGGKVLIQDPASADSPTMPEAAIALLPDAIVADPGKISSLLIH